MNIKSMTVGLAILVLTVISSPAWSMDIPNQSSGTEGHQVLQASSVVDHLRLADSEIDRFTDLEAQIEEIQTRIDKLTNKPYLDTKGFKRQGLQLWKGKLVKELREAADKVVWHKTQAKEILASQEKSHKDS